MPAQFSVALRDEGAESVVVLSGEIDLNAAPVLVEVGTRAGQAQAGAVAVDMTDLTFIDSSGINAVVRIRNAALDVGRAFRVRNVPAPIADMFKLVGLEFLLG